MLQGICLLIRLETRDLDREQGGRSISYISCSG